MDYLHQEDNNNSINFNKKDIELKLLLDKYFKKINSISTISDEVKEHNKTIIKGIIQAYCENNKIDFDASFFILIYPYSTPSPDPYFMYLAYLLCSIEEYEINEYLTHHFLNYTYNQQDFLGRIINYVIEHMQRIMPINNYTLREKIMQWATLKKTQLNTLINDNLLSANTQIVSIERDFIDDLPIADMTLYYWGKDVTQLENLYQILLEEKMIEPNENFVKSFSDFNVDTKYRTVWSGGGHTSLFALLYLLYNKERTFKDETLAEISIKLFTVKNKMSSIESIKETFRTFYDKVDNKFYFQKNHKVIISIYQKICLVFCLVFCLLLHI